MISGLSRVLPGVTAEERVLTRSFVELDGLHQGRSDFLDRLGGRIEPADAFATHEFLCLIDLPATVVERCVMTVGSALGAY